MGNNNKISSVVKIFQKLKQWQKKARIRSHNHVFSVAAPPDVPPGHVAVSVGENHRRYVVRAELLNHPIFQKLLMETEKKYGFSNVGPLAIPCDESLFEKIIEVLNRSKLSGQGKEVTLEDIQRCNHVEITTNVETSRESQPLLLHGDSEKSLF